MPSIPSEIIESWSHDLMEHIRVLASDNRELLFLTAEISPVIPKIIKEVNRDIRIWGVVRGYFWINLQSRVQFAAMRRILSSRRYAEFRFFPLLHSKVLIFRGAEFTTALIGSGNLTKRSFMEELNHYVIISKEEIVSKLINDFSLIWDHSRDDAYYEECSLLPLWKLNQSNLDQEAVRKLVDGYLDGDLDLDYVLTRLNLSIPLYQWLFLSMVAEEMYIFMYLIEFEAAKRIIVPAMLNDATVKIIASNRVSTRIEEMINREAEFHGGKERVRIKILKGLHAKTAVVKDKRGAWLAYIGSAPLTKSGLHCEVNHGVIITDRRTILRLLDDFDACESV